MRNGIFDRLKELLQPWMDLFGSKGKSADTDCGNADASKLRKEGPAGSGEAQPRSAAGRAARFSDVEISGESGKTQKIPVRTIAVTEGEYSPQTAKERFIADMRRYENCVEAPAAASDKVKYGYAGMTVNQQSRYFAWRTEVRAGRYPDTDSAYVRIHAQEMLNGCGWTLPEAGLKQLTELWMNYRERFPAIDAEMFEWTFSFARQHGIDYSPDEWAGIPETTEHAVIDLLVERHRQDRPLKLSFPLVEALCTYPICDSRFFQDGNQQLVAEVMPRVIALADALLLKQNGKGILRHYGPRTGKKQKYCSYKNAVHPEADRVREVTVKAYTTSRALSGYITELVRHAENVLRSIYGCRGRLRVEKLDVQTAERIEEFLRREYGKEKKPGESAVEPVKVILDFDSINALRIQSDAVREALEVVDEREDVREEISSVEIPGTPEVTEAQDLPAGVYFDPDKLSAPMRDLIDALSEMHCRALREILVSGGADGCLSTIADEAMTLPEIIIDEINDAATTALDDILIDVFSDTPRVLEQYEAELKSAAVNGG